ncbi:MAG TPA: amidohydrolase family protein [Streptosporangiaceae bacterium]|nr:amidohydrolase family protein [Streptosporangiaceae bacterium]
MRQTGQRGMEYGISELGLVDHHVHPALATDLDAAQFEELITESDRPVPAGMTQFDSQLGMAIRRWCAPVLGLEPFAPAAGYLAQRAALGGAEVTRRLLRASGTSHFLVDTGYLRAGMLGLDGLAEVAGARADEIVRLETVAEQAVLAGDGSAGGFAGRFAEALAELVPGAVGLKSIVGYRYGLDFDPVPPTRVEVTAAAGRWLHQIEVTGQVRVTDPVLLRHVLWAGLSHRLPLQLHTGFGDPDADLRRCDPLLLRGFIERAEATEVPIMLLHCYPFHRGAGYLAMAYPHVYLDVGLAANYLGARATAVVAESLELAPFGKVLFSSDAWGPPELHYLGALLWRRATARVLGGWVAGGEWDEAEAFRVAAMIGGGNARRVYGLG